MSGLNQPMSAKKMFLRHRRAYRGIAATVCTLSLIGAPAVLAADADPVEKRQAYQRQIDDKAKANQQPGAENQAQSDRQRQLRASGQQQMTRLHDAEKLIGSAVYDRTDREEQVGTLNEIVIDSRSGEIKYGVLSFGGFLGFGDKLFAVPWSAFDFAATTEDEGPRIYAPISNQKLEAKDGFDKDNWPQMADPQWSKDTHERWGQKDMNQRDGQLTPQDRAQQARTQPDRAQADRADQQGQGQGRDAMAQRGQSGDLLRCSTLIGREVDNNADENIGEINELLVTERDGRVAYAVLSLDGDFLDGEKNRVAVPWSALNAQTAQDDDDSLQITLDADKRKIQTVAYNEDQQPQMSDRTWARNVHQTFGQDADMAVLGYTDGSDAQLQSARTDGWRQDSDYNKAYDAKQSKPFSGTIQSVDTFKPDNKSAEGMKLTIESTDGKTHDLHLGPQDQMTRQQVNLKEGAKVTGKGFQPQGKDYIMVESLTVDGKTVQLRDKSGKASWDKSDQTRQPQDRPQSGNRAPGQQDRDVNPEGGRGADVGTEADPARNQ